MLPKDTWHKIEAIILGIDLIFTTPAIAKSFKVLEDPKIKQQVGRTIRKSLKFYLSAKFIYRFNCSKLSHNWDPEKCKRSFFAARPALDR